MRRGKWKLVDVEEAFARLDRLRNRRRLWRYWRYCSDFIVAHTTQFFDHLKTNWAFYFIHSLYAITMLVLFFVLATMLMRNLPEHMHLSAPLEEMERM